MKFYLLLTGMLFLWANQIHGQEFPAQTIWSLDIEDTVSCFGTHWTEDNQACVIVGTNRRVLMIKNGDIVWSSPEIGYVTSACRVVYEDTVSFIATTVDLIDNDDEAIGIVHRFYGDEFGNHRAEPFTTAHGEWPLYKADYIAKSIFQWRTAEEDTLQTIGIWCEYSYFNIDVFGNSTNKDCGIIHRFSLKTMTSLDGEEDFFTYSPNFIDLGGRNENDQFTVLLGGNSGQSNYDHGSDISSSSEECGIEVLSTNTGDLSNVPFIHVGGNIGYRYPPIPVIGIYGATVTESGNLVVGTFAYTPDSAYHNYSIIVLPDLYPIAWLDRPCDLTLLGTVYNENNEEFLIGYTPGGQVIVYLLNSFNLVYNDFYLRAPITGAVLYDFDNDHRKELLVLGGGSMKLYAMGDLSVFHHSLILPPSSLSLSAYPNPFNSSTTINYSLPTPGRYAIDVIDIQGRLVTRLSDGWRDAGSYRAVLNGGELPSGQYLIQLNGINNDISSPITLIK